MRTIRLETGRPILDIISYGRAGPGARLTLTPAQIAQIHRTVSRVPEVVVKVTGGGGSTTGRGVNAHFNYIGRRGELEIETDDGQHLTGRGVGGHLINDWDLDLEEDRKRLDLFATNARKLGDGLRAIPPLTS